MTWLQQEAQAARELVETLRQLGREDDDAIDLSLESETDFKEAVAWALRQVREAEMMAGAIETRRAALEARQRRYQARSERMRDAIRDAIEIAGVTAPIATPEGTVSVRSTGPKLIITDEDALPAAMRPETVVRRVDRAAIMRALKAGEAVPGAVLSNGGQTLQIRS